MKESSEREKSRKTKKGEIIVMYLNLISRSLCDNNPQLSTVLNLGCNLDTLGEAR